MASKAAPENEAPQEVPAAEEQAAVNPPEDRLAVLEEENARLRDQWVRAAAETDNVRKRAQREVEDATKYAVSNFAREMVSVLENLQRATESIPPGARAEDKLLDTLGQGVDLTLQELLAIFNRQGIERVDPLNQKFDHNFHQAVVQVERTDVPAGTVVQVVQAGYTIKGRLLRPAMVAVSKAPETIKHVDTTA